MSSIFSGCHRTWWWSVSSSSSQINSWSRRECQPGPTAMLFKTAIIKLTILATTEFIQLKRANPETKGDSKVQPKTTTWNHSQALWESPATHYDCQTLSFSSFNSWSQVSQMEKKKGRMDNRCSLPAWTSWLSQQTDGPQTKRIANRWHQTGLKKRGSTM